MSIGPSTPANYSLPASIVGTASRNLNETTQARGEAAQQNLRAGQAAFSVRDNEDVMETGLSADRDVDGRLPYDLPQDENQAEDEQQDDGTNEDPGDPSSGNVHHSIDPDGERGGSLDIDA